MEKVTVTVERTPNNLSAYIEILPGCIATGPTLEILEKNMSEAVKQHVELAQEHCEPFPEVFVGSYKLVFVPSEH